MTNFEKVKEFIVAFKRPMLPRPGFPSGELQRMTTRLIAEEYDELLEAEADANLVDLADALGDMAYVVYFKAAAYGINLDAVFAEIHSSNMSKLGPDGEPLLREDGKILKGPNFRLPDIQSVLYKED